MNPPRGPQRLPPPGADPVVDRIVLEMQRRELRWRDVEEAAGLKTDALRLQIHRGIDPRIGTARAVLNALDLDLAVVSLAAEGR